MSLFSLPDAVPSRVLAVYRYLLRTKGQRESRETLERVLMPANLPLTGVSSSKEEAEEAAAEKKALAGLAAGQPPAPGEEEKRGERGMIDRVLTACEEMQLIIQEGGKLALSPALPKAARDPKRAEALAPLMLCDLIMRPENDRNHDLARVISWYLAFDPQQPPMDWDTLDREHREEVRSLGMNNDFRYGQLREWGCYLGFCWTLTFAKRGSKLLVPDPTEHVRRRLPELFPKPQVFRPFIEVLAELAGSCGVFEGGGFRRANEEAGQSKPLDARALTRASAHAWLRLQEEGVVELTHASDAEAILVPEEDTVHRFSQVRWLGEARG